MRHSRQDLGVGAPDPRVRYHAQHWNGRCTSRGGVPGLDLRIQIIEERALVSDRNICGVRLDWSNRKNLCNVCLPCLTHLNSSTAARRVSYHVGRSS